MKKNLLTIVIITLLFGCSTKSSNLEIMNNNFSNKDLSDIYYLTNDTYGNWLSFENQNEEIKQIAETYFNDIATYLKSESFNKTEGGKDIVPAVSIKLDNVNNKELLLTTYVNSGDNYYFSIEYDNKIEFYQLSAEQDYKLYELTIDNVNYPLSSDNIKLIDFNK